MLLAVQILERSYCGISGVTTRSARLDLRCEWQLELSTCTYTHPGGPTALTHGGTFVRKMGDLFHSEARSR